MDTSINLPLRVIKLGGSLLTWREVAERWRAWLARQSPAANLLVVGGGGLADALRAVDVVHRLPPAESHELAIAAMSVTSRLFCRLAPGTPRLARVDDFAAWRRDPGSPAVFDIGALWETGPWRERFAALEPSWDVTSDSLAAALAVAIEAEELTLLKSTDPPPGATLAELAAAGYVDRFFPRAAAGLTVRLVNLRGCD